MQQGETQQPQRSEWIALALILAVAAALRLYGLNAPLWYDEIDTLVNFVRLPVGELVSVYPSLNHHVFFSLQAHFSTALFGESAWSLRLPAALMGVGSIGAVWLVARRVIGWREALFVAALLAVSYHHVWFSQNARGYTGLLFWTALATYYFVRGGEKDNWRNWLAFGVCFAAAMYTHLTAGLFFAGLGLVYAVLLVRRRAFPQSAASDSAFVNALSGWGPFLGFAIGSVLTALLLAPLAAQMAATFTHVSEPTGEAQRSVAAWFNPLWTIQEIGASVLALGPAMALGLPVAIALMGIGLWSLLKKRPLIVAIFFAHIPITIILLVLLSFRVWPRYFFVDAGIALMLLVHGAYVLARWAQPLLARLAPLSADRWAMIACAGMTAASLVLLPRNYTTPKQDFQGAYAYIEAHRKPGDVAASIGLAQYPFQIYYAPSWHRPQTVAEVEALIPAHGELWIVAGFPTHTRSVYPEMAALLNDDFILDREFPGTMGDGWVQVYRSRSISGSP